MLIKGEKWACDACVRGHRVSNCQHTDRKLQHINKKVGVLPRFKNLTDALVSRDDLFLNVFIVALFESLARHMSAVTVGRRHIARVLVHMALIPRVSFSQSMRHDSSSF